MIKILFICHGNICRSTMAQSYMQYLVDRHGMTNEFYIDSAATSTEAVGCSVHHGTKEALKKNGIPVVEHIARQILKEDYLKFDYLIGMDFANIRNIKKKFGEDRENKIKLLLDLAGEYREVADPWYTGDFQTTFWDVKKGCEALFDKLLQHTSL